MTAPARRPRGFPHTALFSLILLLAAGLRVFRISSQSLWADEGNSAAMALRPFSEISARAAADIHPPGYYWLLSLWTKVFGDSEIALRSLSALWGVVLVWLVYQVVRRLFDRRTAAIAGFFTAINPFLIAYSQEARMYAQLAALAALLFYGLVRFILHESRVLAADGSAKSISFSRSATLTIVLASLAGLYTHYTFPILAAAATLIYALWVLNSRRRGFVYVRVLHWAMLLIVIGFLYLPWARTALQQLTNWPRSEQAVSLGAAAWEMLKTLAFGSTDTISAASPWVLVVLGLLILGLWPWIWANRRRAHWLSWGLPLLWLAAPAGLVLLAGLYKPAYLKFLLAAVAPLTILLSRGVMGFAAALARGQWSRRTAPQPARSQRSGKQPPPALPPAPVLNPTGKLLSAGWIVLAVALVTVPSALALANYYFDPKAARDDYRSTAAFISAVAGPNDAILLDAPGQQEVFDYYYRGPLPVYALPEQRPIDPAATVARLKQIAQQHPHLYTLYWATAESDPTQVVETWLDDHAYKADDRWQGNMRFVIYATQQPTEAWPVQASGAVLGDQIRLLTYALSTHTIMPGEVLQLQLQWQAERPPDADYALFVQLLDPRDQVVAQHDAPPGGDENPTDGWQPGVKVLDHHGVLIPYGTPPGDYRMIAGLYDPTSGQRLPVNDRDFIDLGAVTVARPAVPAPVSALRMQVDKAFNLGEITLLGHDRYKRGYGYNPEEPLHRNDLLHLTLYWQANIQPTSAWWFTVRLVSGADTEIAAVSGPLVSDLYPTLNWQAGEIVRGEHDMLIPDYVQPGRYQLQLFLHTGNPTDGVDRINLGWVVVS